MDPKTEYSNSVQQQKIASQSDLGLAKQIAEGKIRKQQNGQNWQEVDINDVFQKFGILASTKTYVNGKIVFYNSSQSIAIITDVGYFRIQDMSVNTKTPRYLDINGNDAHNITINGKIRGRTNAEYHAATHFIIKKRGK